MQLAKTVKFDNYDEAAEELYKGNLGGIIVLPQRMSADIQSQKQPEVHYYINSLYIINGALAYKALLTMTNTANAAVQREVYRKLGYPEYKLRDLIQPIAVDAHQIGNAENNYGYYLTNILLPAFLEMIVILVLSYSLGAELKYGTSRHLLDTTHGSMIDALLGKLFVYTILFTGMGMAMILILYNWAHFPIAGSLWHMFLAIIMLVLASEGISVFIIGCLPVPRLALSISALYSVLGFSLSGFTLPTEVMPSFVQGLSAAFPIGITIYGIARRSSTEQASPAGGSSLSPCRSSCSFRSSCSTGSRELTLNRISRLTKEDENGRRKENNISEDLVQGFLGNLPQ